MNKLMMLTTTAFIVATPAIASAQDSFGGQQPAPQQAPGQWGQQPAPQPAPGQWGQQPAPPQAGASLDQLMQMERQDFGVQPTKSLHNGPMHGPTPVSIPGGQLINKGLVSLVQGKQAPYFLFDVLGGPEMLPGAMPNAWLAQPGAFNDQVQQQMAQMFQQGTQGRKDIPLNSIASRRSAGCRTTPRCARSMRGTRMFCGIAAA